MGHARRITAGLLFHGLTLGVALGSLMGCAGPGDPVGPDAAGAQEFGPPHPDHPLPAAWLGTWIGELHVAGSEGVDARVPMTLAITSTDDPARWDFALEFGTGSEVERRAFGLRKDRDLEGALILEEQGTELRVRRLGRQMILHATVGESWIFVRYELDRGQLLYEAFGGPTEIPREWIEGQSVASFPTESFQRAVLRRRGVPGVENP